MSHLLRIVALSLGGLLLSSSEAAAASLWSAPSTAIAAPASPPAPGLAGASARVTTDAAGNLTAVWLGDASGAAGVQTATRPAGGSWSAPSLLAADPAGAAEPTDRLTLSESPSGHAIAAWVVSPRTGSSSVQTATRTPDGRWSAATALEPAAPAGSSSTAVAYALGIDAAGTAVGAWSRDLDAAGAVTSAFGTAAQAPGGAWQSAAGPGESVSELRVGVDGAGNATLLFIGGAEGRVYAASRPAGGSWQGATPIDGWTPSVSDPSPAASAPALAVDAAGDAVAIWQRYIGEVPFLQSATRLAGGSWSAPRTVSAGDESSGIDAAQVGIDATGRATVLWSETGSDPRDQAIFTSDVRTSSAALGAAWTPAARLADQLRLDTSDPAVLAALLAGTLIPRIYFSPVLTVNQYGAAAALWRSGVERSGELQGAVRREGGEWEPAQRIAAIPDTATSADPDMGVAVDPLGQATALWADGGKVSGATVRLSDRLPATPPVQDPQNTQTPAPGKPAGPATPATPAKPAAAPKPTTGKRLVLSVNLVPSRTGRCPKRAVATVAGVRRGVPLKRTRLRNKKIVCAARATVTLKQAAALSTPLKVVLTAKGVKRKALLVAPTI